MRKDRMMRPSYNSVIQDLGSLVTFLKICHPLNDAEMYKRLVLRPLKDGDPRGAGILRVSVASYVPRLELVLIVFLAEYHEPDLYQAY